MLQKKSQKQTLKKKKKNDIRRKSKAINEKMKEHCFDLKSAKEKPEKSEIWTLTVRERGEDRASRGRDLRSFVANFDGDW